MKKIKLLGKEYYLVTKEEAKAINYNIGYSSAIIDETANLLQDLGNNLGVTGSDGIVKKLRTISKDIYNGVSFS